MRLTGISSVAARVPKFSHVKYIRSSTGTVVTAVVPSVDLQDICMCARGIQSRFAAVSDPEHAGRFYREPLPRYARCLVLCDLIKKREDDVNMSPETRLRMLFFVQRLNSSIKLLTCACSREGLKTVRFFFPS